MNESYAESFAQEDKPGADYDFEQMSEEDIAKAEKEVAEIEFLSEEQRKHQKAETSTYYPWLDKLT
jgi:hypothetical protein